MSRGRWQERAFRLLLRLFPSEFRGDFGEQMLQDFRDQQQDVRGRFASLRLWTSTAVGILRQGPREHLDTLMRDLSHAARLLRARGWRAALAVGLLAVAIAANALLFATADSLVFARVPYPNAQELIELQRIDAGTRQPAGTTSLSAALLEEWQKQTDVFAAVHGHLHTVIFLTGAGEPELVRAADVTVGLMEALGVRPRWGRSLFPGDERPSDAQAVLIAESLARERFGDPAEAVGALLPTTAAPLRVVGVMPADFRFPRGDERIWRTLDPRGLLAEGFAGVALIARLAPGLSMAVAAPLVETRSVAVGEAAGAPAGYAATAAPLSNAISPASQRQMLLVLLSAALCLLLLACANVASLELASAITRARAYAVQLALGASRGTIVRVTLLEAGLVLAAATVAAVALANVGVAALVERLPPEIIAGSANPVAIDSRAVLFMLAVAAVACLLCAAPVIAFTGRANLLDILKTEGLSATSSRAGSSLRRALAVTQIALAVVLLVASVLYVRTYSALLRLDKGFDSSGVVQISLIIPPQRYGTAAERALLTQMVLERLRAHHGVIAAFDGAPPPWTGDTPMGSKEIEVDDRPPQETDIRLPKLRVEPDYFQTLGIPLIAGRMFERGEPPTNVLITESLARRLWPNGDAVGRRFRESPRLPWSHVIGIVPHVRTLHDTPAGPDQYFQVYVRRQPPPPTTTMASDPGPGMVFRFLSFTARIQSHSTAGDLYQIVRGIDPHNILRVEFADDLYARQHAARRLAATIVSAFGLIAFVVAAAGIFGMMTFLVASREREIGIHVALGADAQDVRRLVVDSALRLAAMGTLLGVGLALAAGRWIESQLFGVTAADPLTFLGVGTAVIATTLLAAWPPARRATRVDPTLLLKG